ncbi:shikimate dehydrogenase [Tenacibaculum sp. 190524A02b]|uniref:Shikimate dehydrogenase n=1 Tax=Tenacibaculum vairaonense TaxID=3137860 RepID=A0ABM9PKB9_9FLAO
MEKNENKQLFSLIGKNISYSFSRGYFTEKFEKLGLDNCEYVNFDFQSIQEFPAKLKAHFSELKGMNVTIPYKLEIFEYLDEVDEQAKAIGAVNTIKITSNGKLKGYNTDAYGFKQSLKPLLKEYHKKALILGTGGASKAVAFVLDELGIDFLFVSRQAKEVKTITYQEVTEQLMIANLLIINCTPLGTHPNVEDCPDIPYEFITNKHLLYDLIYNPSETTFLKHGKEKGAVIKNGLEMLEQQAEKAWKIWHK